MGHRRLAIIAFVADMSSTILSRSIDVLHIGLIYACAQKNLGPPGLTVVIVRSGLLGRVQPAIPSVFSDALQAHEHCMYNTPSTFAWYVARLVLQWLKRQAGLAAMAEVNRRKLRRSMVALTPAAAFITTQ